MFGINMLDFILICLLVLSFIFGLIGKAWKKHVSVACDFVAILVCFFATPFVTNVVYENIMQADASTIISSAPAGITLLDYLKETVLTSDTFAQIASVFPSAESLVTSMPKGIIQVFVFTGLTLSLMLSLNIIAKIIGLIATSNKKAILKKASSTLGIPAIVRSTMVFLVILYPLFVFGGVAGASTALAEGEHTETVEYSDTTTTGTTISTVFKVINESKVKTTVTKVFDKDWFIPAVYSDEEGKSYNIYAELLDLETSMKIVPMVQGLDGSSSSGDTDEVTKLKSTLNGIIDLLEGFNDIYSSLHVKSHIKLAFTEALEYLFIEGNTSTELFTKFAPTTVTEKEARKEAIANGNLETLFVSAFNSIFDSFIEDYPEISFMGEVTFSSIADIRSGVTSIADMLIVYNKVMKDGSDLTNVSASDIKSLIKGLGNSALANEMLKGFAQERGFNIDIENEQINWEAEADAVVELLRIANGEEFSEVEFRNACDVLLDSHLALIVASAQDEGSIVLTSENYEIVTQTIAEKFSSDSSEYNTFISLFKSE